MGRPTEARTPRWRRLDCPPVSLSIGIVGLPNVGKSTLFNALTKNDVLAANYPFATIEPNVGVVGVPDPRLTCSREMFDSREDRAGDRVASSTSPGIVKGASEGQGLGNKFLANIREADAICQVIRVFTDPDVAHVDGRVGPRDDIETINTELILADLQTIENARCRAWRRRRGWRRRRAPVLRRRREGARGPRHRHAPLFAAGRRPRAAARAAPAHRRSRSCTSSTSTTTSWRDEALQGRAARAGRARRGDLPRREDRVRADRAARRRGARAAAVDRPAGVGARHSSRASASRRSGCRRT